MTSDNFIDYLLQFDTLNTQQIELIKSLLVIKDYKEGEYFLEAGRVSKEIGFILTGVFRVCYYNNKGEEITRYFLDEGNFMVDLMSYTSGISSTEYVQSVTTSKILTLNKSSMDTLSKTIITWDKIISKITVIALSEKLKKVSLMMPQDAAERYDFFLANFPHLANRVPLQYIASYIGITKSSLSRLRRDISKK
ncbi:Crp/Fnr family transcriptional regulator [Algoriphagus lacus]|uniref:Crp/Fnr family transcriptional regulator n=1 Tax=Algoriphagus lacus TaxID=2056311 RepID=A0A418PNI9_9BACT|nr:Crp/Fnr family transcriptional regulator [Algoriphagus lacus]RIW13419.1 Crp/Fnr family transcriptional regulator [Algoriphagus lacus]